MVEKRADSVEPRIDWMQTHLHTLFQPYIDEGIDGRFEIRCIPQNGGRAESTTYALDDYKGAIDTSVHMNTAGWNVYVAPNLRDPNVSPVGACNAKDVIAAAFNFADCDSEASVEALRRIEPYAHQITVATGISPNLRIHTYWRHDTVCRNLDAWSDIQKCIQETLQSDKVHDAPRIMRLAGTVNYPSDKKKERGYRTEIVQIQLFDERDPVEPDTLRRMFPVHAPKAQTSGLNLTQIGRSDADLLALLEASKVPGQWHNNMRDAVATLIGRGHTDTQIRLMCGAYCDAGPGDKDLDDLILGGRQKWPGAATNQASALPPPLSHDEALDKFRFSWWGDLEAESSIDWTIAGLLPRQAFGVLYGKPGSFKSFIAISMAAFVAGSDQWFGRDVKGGSVLYIAGEGQAGLGLRRDAILAKFDIPSNIKLGFIRTQVDLCSPQSDLQNLLTFIHQTIPNPTLIIIDTLSRALAGGDENSPQDMGAFIVHVGRIMEETGAGVLAIHHCGKDEARGMRGHSSLLGAVDTELEIVRPSPDQKSATITITKQKDGEDGIHFGVEMEEISLTVGQGLKAHEVKTLVAVPSDQVHYGRPSKPKSQYDQGLELLRRAIEERGQPVPGQPQGVVGVEIETWKTYCKVDHLSGSENDETLRRAFDRTKRRLVSDAHIVLRGGIAWIIQ